MAYVMNGVTVEVSRQAVRPREPSRPSRASVTASAAMYTRALRPREQYAFGGLGAVVATTAAAVRASIPVTRTTGPVADAYLQQISTLKGHQQQLEALLAKMGADLKAQQAALVVAQRTGNKASAATLQTRILTIQHDVVLCIDAIKACAAKVADAAQNAVDKGATVPQVKAAAAGVVVTAPPPPPKMTAAVMPGVSPLVPKSPTSAMTTVVESNTASITADGTLVPGPGAEVIETPVLTEPGAPASAPVASSSGAGKLAVFGIVAFIGYHLLKKK